MNGIEFITSNFKEHGGTYLVVSHDRSFLDRTCNKILEIENGKIKLYNGNYSKKEKRRLMNVKEKTEIRSSRIKNAPSRMGNSEARLHKMGGQSAKKNLDNPAKAVQTRIEHVEVKEKPVQEDIIKIKILDSSKPHSKILVSGKDINKSYGENVIFKNTDFSIYNGKKIALMGPNGSGKTTLINMILKGEGIDISENVKIGIKYD